MQSYGFTPIANRFSTLRSPFRRSSNASSRSSSHRGSYASYSSQDSSTASTINSVIFRQPSVLDLEEERRSFGQELNILEPRPVVFFSSMEERMGHF